MAITPRTAVPALELRDISKSFGSVSALSSVDLAVYPYETHAVVGDNGAGKSTMIKIVAGVHTGDGGEMLVNGQTVELTHDAAEAKHHGISILFQDLALVEGLDIATNMALGNLPRRYRLFLDRKRMNDEASRVLQDLNVRVTDVTTPVGLLSGGQRQVVAIARAIRLDAPVILLDEPTAALGVQESARIGTILDGLKESGKAVLCVSHDLEFVFRHADRITVLRLGESVGTREVASTSREEIISMITGATPSDRTLASLKASRA